MKVRFIYIAIGVVVCGTLGGFSRRRSRSRCSFVGHYCPYRGGLRFPDVGVDRNDDLPPAHGAP